MRVPALFVGQTGVLGEAALEFIGEKMDGLVEVIGALGGDDVGAGAFDDAFDGVAGFPVVQCALVQIETHADHAVVAEQFFEKMADFVLGIFAEGETGDQDFGVHELGNVAKERGQNISGCDWWLRMDWRRCAAF